LIIPLAYIADQRSKAFLDGLYLPVADANLVPGFVLALAFYSLPGFHGFEPVIIVAVWLPMIFDTISTSGTRFAS